MYIQGTTKVITMATYIDNLPFELQNIIYQKKHHMEMKDVFENINYFRQDNRLLRKMKEYLDEFTNSALSDGRRAEELMYEYAQYHKEAEEELEEFNNCKVETYDHKKNIIFCNDYFGSTEGISFF